MADLTVLDSLIRRLKKLNIEVELVLNAPWIYISKINGKTVKEKYQGRHGFTVAFYPIKLGGKLQLTDISKIFKLIRMYSQTQYKLRCPNVWAVGKGCSRNETCQYPKCIGY